MTGDCHVRFCESLRRKPWATRQLAYNEQHGSVIDIMYSLVIELLLPALLIFKSIKQKLAQCKCCVYR